MSGLGTASKLAFVFSAALLSLLSWSPLPLALGSAAAVAVYALTSRESPAMKGLIRAVLYTVVAYVPAQAVFYWGYYFHRPVTVLLYIIRPGGGIAGALTGGMGIAITLQGIYWGALSSLKFLVTFFAAVAFIGATGPSEIIYMLQRARAPRWAIAASSIALSLLPYALEDSRIATSAVMKRDIKGPRALLKPIYAVKALVYQSVRRAYMVSLSLEQKGYPESIAAPEDSSAIPFIAGAAFIFAVLVISQALAPLV